MGSEQDYAIAERVTAVAERLGCNPAQVALAWVLGLPGVTAPIRGRVQAASPARRLGSALNPARCGDPRLLGGALQAKARLRAFLKFLLRSGCTLITTIQATTDAFSSGPQATMT